MIENQSDYLFLPRRNWELSPLEKRAKGWNSPTIQTIELQKFFHKFPDGISLGKLSPIEESFTLEEKIGGSGGAFKKKIPI